MHLRHAGGGSFDLRGFDGALCNMVSAANLSLNARFTFVNFTLAPEDPRSLEVRAVDGSHLTAGFITVRAASTTVKVDYDAAARPYRARVLVAKETAPELDMSISTAHGPLIFGDVSIEMRQAQPVELVLATADWRVVLRPATYRTVDGERKTRLDLSVVALADPLEAAVAPHGLLGQGFHGLHIDGKTDDYVPNENGVFVTTAQGEGAIEGTVADYIVAGPFATSFKYARFGALAAPSRDTSKLNVPAGAPKPMSRGARATGSANDALA